MGKKAGTVAAAKPVKAASSKPNPSAGKLRPFVARNLGRLDKIAEYFGSMMKDLDRATGSDQWIAVAKSASKDFAKAWDEVQGALKSAPADYTTSKRSNGRSKATAAFKVGMCVQLSTDGHAKYDASKVGDIGTVGTVVDVQVGGILVQFPVEGTYPQFVRGAHVTAVTAAE